MSCFGGRDELLFLIELTVERLKLTADKYREDFAEQPPQVRIKILDFPTLEVEPRSDAGPAQLSMEYDENEGLIYACGKSVLFVKKPRDLVASMKSQPLKLGVFRPCETFPIAEVTIPYSGCLCDMVAMAGNDPEHRPKPYELVGGYAMCDPGENYAGSINIFFRLSFFGPYIISNYQLYEDSCIFKNDFDGQLKVTKVDEPVDEDNSDDDDDDQLGRKKFKIGSGVCLQVMRSEVDSKPKPKNDV